MSTEPGDVDPDPDADPEMLQSKAKRQPDQAEGDDTADNGATSG